MDMSIEITQRLENRVVTPEDALELLNHNYEDNRNIRDSYVEQLAFVMKQGRFVSQNGQTIVVGADDGILYDGQHRLKAVVKSGVPQVFCFAYVKDGKNVYKTIDNGTRRQAADFIQLPSKSCCACISKIMACVEWGEAPLVSCLQGKWNARTQVDRDIVVTYATQHSEEVVDAMRKGGVMASAVGNRARNIISAFIMIVRYCGMDDELDSFIGDFTRTAPANPTVIALKTRLLKEYASSRGVPDNGWLLGTLLDGYTHFSEDDGSTMLNKQKRRLADYQRFIEAERQRRSRRLGGDAE